MDKSDLHVEIDESLKINCRTINKLEDCKNALKTSNFIVLSCNIRGLQHKASTGELFVALKRFDICYDAIVFSECWFNTPNPHIPTIPGYNAFHTTKVINKCGGITIYVKECWSAKAQEPVFEDGNCLVINIPDLASIVGIYRSPAVKDITKFISSLEQNLEPIKNLKNLIVAGDMNINLIDKKPDRSNATYQCLMAELGLLPAITMPTRGNNCLDHIFVNTNVNVLGLICESSLTDHHYTMAGLSLTSIKGTKNRVNRVKTTTNFAAIVEDLKTKDWNLISKIDNVNDAVNMLNNFISNLVDKHTHRAKMSRSRHHLKPWITPGLIRCMRHRDNLHLKVRQQPINYNLKTTYNRYRNFCNGLLRKVKSDYDNSQITKHHKDPKKLWKTIKEVCDIPRAKNESLELLQAANTPLDAVNMCNQHFATVGSKLASDILNGLSATQETLCRNMKLETQGPDSLFLYATDQYEINNLIMDLKTDSAPGIDTFTPTLLKHIRFAIVDPVAHICNLSMETGVFPECWKTAIVCPIYKGGPKDRVENYRPISLLPILSKILEKIVNKRLVDYLEKNNLLSDRQYGFRRGRCTEDAVELLTSTLASHMDKGNRCMGVFLDLAKAFDTVSTKMLLKKLRCLGVRGNTLLWFTSYLSNRRQRLRIGEHLSDELNICFGVPQGSILSPTLFCIYMNDILKLKLPNADLICYADDTVAVFYGKNWQTVVSAAEKGMSLVSRWLDQNLLTLNVVKTNYIPFHINRATEPKFEYIKIHRNGCLALLASPTSTYSCTCHCINKVDSIKYLGVCIDQNLSFEQHIIMLSKRVRKFIFLMKTLRPAAKIEIRKLVYVSLCQSLLQYCIGVWGGAAKSSMIDVERAQRAVLKVMLGKPRRYPTQQLLQEAEVLSVRQLFLMKAVAKVHSITQVSQKRQRRQVRPAVAALPKVKTVFASRLPPYIHFFAYNGICKLCSLEECLHRTACARVKKWLMSKTYIEIELLVKVYDCDC